MNQANSRFTLTIVGDNHRHTVLDALEAECGLSRTSLKKALNCGAVWLGKAGSRKRRRLRRASRRLGVGEILELYYDHAIIESSGPEPLLLEQSDHFSLWYKPHCCLTQGSRYGDHLSVLRQAEKKLDRIGTIHPVHRLDREASGLVLLAHGRKSAAALSRQFQTRAVEKRYQALVSGRLGSCGDRLRLEQPLDGATALTEVRIGCYHDDRDRTELLITIETGRKHQIRRHLALLGHPVCGDRRYGHEPGKKSSALALCGWGIGFRPPGSTRKITRELPEELRLFFKNNNPARVSTEIAG